MKMNLLPNKFRKSYRAEEAKKLDDKMWYCTPWSLTCDASGRLWMDPDQLIDRNRNRTMGGTATVGLRYDRPGHLVAYIRRNEDYIWRDNETPRPESIPVDEILEVG